MGDAVGGKVLSDGHFRGHDDVVGRGEHGVHTGGDERGGGGDDLVVGVRGLLDVLDALGVEVSLGVRDGLGGVRLIEGVEQADLGDVRGFWANIISMMNSVLSASLVPVT